MNNDNKGINDIFRRFENLASERAVRENTWDKVIAYSNPDDNYVQTTNVKGQIETAHIYDSTATQELFKLASSLNTMLTSQFSNWFELTTDNEPFNDSPEGKQWLEDTTEYLSKSFQNSNFYTEATKFYFDLCSIGTAVMYEEEDTRYNKELQFSTRHIKEIYLAENKYHEIDTVFRKITMSARQVVQRWGEDAISTKLKQKYEKNPDTEVTILHCVYPREDYDMDKSISEELPIASYWFEYEGKHQLEESGYQELPYIVTRWEVTSGEVFGRSPMYKALPAVITLNRMMYLVLLASEISIKPALKGTPDLTDYNETIEIAPGSVTIIDPGRKGDLSPIWDATRGISIGIDIIKIFRDQITDIFLGNQLQTIDKGKMTAEEVRARIQENSKVIGPTFGRLESEFLDKLITRSFKIISRQVDEKGESKIKPLPLEIDGDLTVKFISPLAKSQRAAVINGIYSTVNWALEVSQANPEILDNINFDETLTIMADIQDAPAAMLLDPKIVAQIRQARQQQQQQMMQMQQQQMQQEAQAKAADAGKTQEETKQIRNESGQA